MAPRDPIAQLNSCLIGRYAVERELGTGGMATVFLAEDLKHRRKVALKVLRPELAAVLGADRFVQEIATTASLHHPHLLPLYDSGEAEGLLFYVMPYMEGETLRERMNRETMLPVDDALRITAAVASALDYAHRHGVVHRDLKPENILISDGEPVVSDFGIALAVSNAGGARMTQTGMSLGTPQYMSPEQATGDRQIDARTDVYSLAAVLYEMLTGDPPHAGHNAQAVIAKVITERPRGLRETRDAVPAHVETAVLRGLAKLPADRFATAAEFAAAIAARGATMPVAATHAGAPGVLPERAVARRGVVGAAVRRWGIPAGALLVATLVGSAIAASRSVRVPVQPLRFDIHWTEARLPNATLPGNLAFSRDGTKLVRALAGRLGIYSRPMDGLLWTLIPGTDSTRATAPTFSPNGKFILYSIRGPGSVDRHGYLLMRMPVDGGAPVQIADSIDSDGTSWGDRDRVAFFRAGKLWTVSAFGDTPRLLAAPDSAKHQAEFETASFLPGGDAVLVSIVHGSRATESTPSELDSEYVGAVRVSDGKVTDFGIRGVGAKYSLGHIIYTESSGTLIAQPFDSRRLRVTGPPIKLAEGALVNAVANDMLVSDNGWIVYVPKTVAAAATSSFPLLGLNRITRPATVRSLNVVEQSYISMSVSPDGERIALCVAAAGTSSDVWILQVATGHLNPLTRDGTACYPVWTRDGKRVAYRVGSNIVTTPGKWFSIPWDLSGAPEPVPGTDGAVGYEPGPAGGYFATVRLDSTPASAAQSPYLRSDIWIAPVDTPQARRPFAATSGGEWAPRLSPDGKWLAYMLYEAPSAGGTGAPPKIYVRPVPGPGALIPITTGFGFDPYWGKDESTLYYQTDSRIGGRSAAHLALGRASPVLGFDATFSVGSKAAPVWGGYAVLPSGDIIELAATQAAAPTARPAPRPPPNPVALFGWLDLVNGSAKAAPPAP